MSKAKIDQAKPDLKPLDVNDGLGLRVAQLQVLSWALAHVTHDVQNHLAIIHESAGWMKDLLKMRTKQRFGWIGRFFKRGQNRRLKVEPFFRGLNTIQEQIVQGSALNQHLSCFARRLKENEGVFDGNKALEEIRDILLIQARKKGIRLEIRLPKGALMIETNPPIFQLAVFGNVEQVMENLESGDWLVLEAGVGEGRFQVSLTSPCHEGPGRLLPEELNGQDFSQDIVEELGGQIWRQSGDGKCVTTLAFSLVHEEA
ncbi:MAG: hypothetical protein JRJ42_01845 [Deltaproteobacteria bacterium]|nr:hypothetical protein [Deltaproteobacteria bacterium]MBW2018664.1 hypothetical protein [Deltaproteobacteria bacterium]MBW2073393.1 hypothetical protein [Deltaproteobacteria bacterium]RLB83949.1 MAG: hypothetical protein DRH17_00260 [Deltaproteobacteria bacterium]